MTVDVRAARSADAVEVCQVVRASIEQLCSLDHRGSAAILSAWLGNKTPGDVASWLSNPKVHVLVAEQDGVIVGAGGSTIEGEIVLNYVSPSARFAGVSSALLSSLERQARQDGNSEIRLDSTATARRFYQRRGYIDAGAPGEKFGLRAFPMKKALAVR